jgi:hypothetical protein
MTKTPTQLDAEIAASLATSAIAPVLKKWRAGVAAYRRAVAQLEAGADDWQPARKALDKLDKLIHQAAQHAPLSYKDPAVDALHQEKAALPSFSEARERGQAVRSKARDVEIGKLRTEEREARRPYDWMKR